MRRSWLINIPAVAPPSSRQDCSGLRFWEARNIASSCGLTCSSWTSTQLKNKDEDRVVKNNEGLPQPFLGSCNDRARQLQASSSGIQSPGGSKESDSVKVARGVKAVSRRTQSLVERFERRDTITLPEER
ncbi:uncharacterized protein LOC130501716 [Raphanus sativus]|uniref:Uncharacterized protein LOC130501716 n=1 Tax=Raphanus sativus TaxID=3726 RepID=A0A9W3CMK6_RAPSA|nr:uncharacterized protein LOC130501716 [Raphanus sativus]